MDEDVKVDEKIKVDENVKIDDKIKIDENVKIDEPVNFYKKPPPPPPPPNGWFQYLRFAGPKRNFTKRKEYQRRVKWKGQES